jgi:hypothetical protein
VRSPRTQQADRLQSPTAGPVLLRQPVTGAAIRDCVRPLAESLGWGRGRASHGASLVRSVAAARAHIASWPYLAASGWAGHYTR